jgi:transcriptional regulator with XRE-family HTH domain
MDYSINERVAELLKSRNIDEIQAAKILGKNKSVLYNITGKKAVPTKTTVKLIADAFGVDYYYLYTGQVQSFNGTQNDWRAMYEREKALKEAAENNASRMWKALVRVMNGEKIEIADFLEALSAAGLTALFPGRSFKATA